MSRRSRSVRGVDPCRMASTPVGLLPADNTKHGRKGRVDLVALLGSSTGAPMTPAMEKFLAWLKANRGAIAGAIDANITTGGDDTDVSAALIGRNFLVVRGSEGCPSDMRTARTEPHQP